MIFTYRYNLGGHDCHNCYHLLGIDVILDDKLQPIIIEVSWHLACNCLLYEILMVLIIKYISAYEYT